MSRILNKKILESHTDAAREYLKQSKHYKTLAKATGTLIHDHMAKDFLKRAEEQMLMAALYIAEDEEV